MGMMTRMRDQMHVVLWALLVLFLLSMSIGGLVGGANIIDQLTGKVDPRKAIGVVNGVNLSPDQFMQMVNGQLEQARYEGREVTDQQLASIRSQVWEQMVTEVLIGEILEDLDISATDDEILYHLLESNTPPPILQNIPDFYTDGQFDMAKYRQAAMNPQGDMWLPVEEYMRNTYIPNFKLQQIINASASVSQSELEEEFKKRTVNYTIDALLAVSSKFSDESTNPTEKEIAASYKKDIDSYHRNEMRELRFVSWRKNASQADTARVYEEAYSLKAQAESGADFTELANLYTEDPGNAVTQDSGRGGSLGWFGKDQMVKPFSDAAFAARKGAVVGPVLSRFGYHVIKVLDRRTQDGKEEVNAAHILLEVNIGANTREELRRSATLFSYDAEDYGFDAALDTHSVTARTAANLDEESIFISGLGQFRSAVRFAFNEEVGTVSTPLENDQYYAVFVVDTVLAEGIRPLADVSKEIENKLKREKQQDAAKELMTKLKASAASSSFDALKGDDEKLEVISGVTATLNRSFTSLGQSNYLNGALSVAKTNDLLGPFGTTRGSVLVKVVAVSELDSTEMEVQSDMIRNELMVRKQSQAYNTWIQGLRDEAEIVDNRKYYF